MSEFLHSFSLRIALNRTESRKSDHFSYFKKPAVMRFQRDVIHFRHVTVAHKVLDLSVRKVPTFSSRGNSSELEEV